MLSSGLMAFLDRRFGTSWDRFRRLLPLALTLLLALTQTPGKTWAGQEPDLVPLEGKTLRVTVAVDGPSGGYRATWVGRDLRVFFSGPGFRIIPAQTEFSLSGGVAFESRSWSGGGAYTDTFFTSSGGGTQSFTLSEDQLQAHADGRPLPPLPIQIIVFGQSYLIPANTLEPFAGTRTGRTEEFHVDVRDQSTRIGPEVRSIDRRAGIDFVATVTIGDRAGPFAGNRSAAPAPRSRVSPVGLSNSGTNGFSLFDPQPRTIESDDPLSLELDDSFSLTIEEGFSPYTPISMNWSSNEQGGVRPYTATVEWSLDARVDLTAMLEQPDRTWRPRYRSDPDAGDPDTVDVTARLTTPGIEGRWRFTLSEVSAVPGVAMNLGSGVGYDLRFDRTRAGWGPEQPTLDGFTIETTRTSSEATVRVQSFDHGAWAKLSAEVNVGGRWYDVATADDNDYVTIPVDDNEDRVADFWAETYRVDSLGADWDGDDEPEGGADVGDGLTVYEEYRGFAASGIVLSTDPRRRTLFIHAPNGLASYVTAPIDRGIQVLFIDEAEFIDTATRVVNFNHDGYAHRGDQHGLWLLDLDINGRLFWGVAEGTGAEPQALRLMGSPGSCSRVLVDRAQIEWDLGHRRRFLGVFGSGRVYADLTEAIIAETVDHELSHCLSMRHHDPERALPVCVMRYSYADMELGRLSADMVGTAYCEMNWAELDVSDPH